LSARLLPAVGGSQPLAKSSPGLATGAEPYHRRKCFLVRCTARPEQEKLKAESEAKPKR
jgi:hypothetical protein